jgi:hypothetical protein
MVIEFGGEKGALLTQSIQLRQKLVIPAQTRARRCSLHPTATRSTLDGNNQLMD